MMTDEDAWDPHGVFVLLRDGGALTPQLKPGQPDEQLWPLSFGRGLVGPEWESPVGG